MKLILASQSPRRKELLEKMGLTFEIRLAEHDETMDPAADPAAEVARVSLCKARAAAPLCSPEDVIIGADTIVVCDGVIMGKPHSPQEAEEMLTRLSGRTHEVMTGLALCRGTQVENTAVITRLRFRNLTKEEIRAYVATGEPMDKAGAYGIQGLASLFVESLEGDYYNVMGLPVCTLGLLLRKFGIRVLGSEERGDRD